MKGLKGLSVIGVASLVAAALLAWGQPFAVTAQGMPSFSEAVQGAGGQGFTLAAGEGEEIFAAKCVPCHGARRNTIPTANLSSAQFLASRGDATLVESITKGKGPMPAWGATLSQEEIAAVVAYLKAAAAGTPADGGKEPAGASSTTLTLSATNAVPILLEATLKDSGNKPVSRAMIRFTVLSDFLSGTRSADAALAPKLLAEVQTNAAGVARLDFTPHQDGDIQLQASYEGSDAYRPTQAKAVITVAPEQQEGYVPRAGIRPLVPLQPPGTPNEYSVAQKTGISFPISAPWGLALLLGGIWTTFFVVAYQVMGIGLAASVGSVLDRRLVPLFIAGFVVALGSTLVWMVLTSPYAHSHLGPPPVPWPVMEDTHHR